MSTNNSIDRAAVKGKPPAYMLMVIALAWIFEKYVLPLPLNWDTPGSKIAGWGLIIVGFGINISIARMMRNKGTSIVPTTPTTTLITTGIYKITRNPVYLLNGIVISGACILIGTWWGVPAVILNWILNYYWAIKPEEAYLESKFGQEYLDYKKRVRRWI